MMHLKKTVAVVLAILFAITPPAGVPFEPVFAADSVTVTTAVKEGKVVRGEEVVFSVALSDSVSVKSMALDLGSAYDHNLFEWVDGAWSDEIEFSAVTDVNAEYELASFMNQTAIEAKGEVFTLTLRVKDTALCGEQGEVKVVSSGIDGATAAGASVTVSHKYANACAAACQVCDEKRQEIEHEYESVCDTTCNSCGATRTAPHSFSGDGDEVCDLCGEKRSVSYTVTTAVSEKVFSRGDSVTVTVSLDKARQTKSFALDFLTAYSHDAFEWVSGDWAQSVKELNVLTDVNAGSEAIFLAAGGTEVPAGEIFTFTLRVKNDASCLKAYEIKVGATSIPNLTLAGEEILLNHDYSADCDPRCDVCEKPRTASAEHTYDNVCDTACNLCGTTRTVSHDYEFSCSSVCGICGQIRVTNHTYSNDWDDFCDVCGETRDIARTLNTVLETDTAAAGENVTVKITLTGKMDTNAIGLDFENAYDHDVFEWVDGYWSGAISFAAFTEVNPGVDALFLSAEEITIEGLLFTMVLRVKDTAKCGDTYSLQAGGSALREAVLVGDTLTLSHAYDNACDDSCNVCGEIRPVAGHSYDNSCDTDCNACGAVREIQHTYDNEGDEECNVCGETRVVERTLTTSIASSETSYGKELTVTVSIDKAVKLRTFGLDFVSAYDHDAFEWVDGSWNDAIEEHAAVSNVDPGNAAVFLFSDAMEISGTLFTFTLRVKKGNFCGNSYEIKASCSQLQNVTLAGDTVAVVHAIDGACDGFCEGCGLTQVPTADHVYDHDGDEACNVCGEIRLAFYGTSLSLQHNFAINYKVKKELAQKYTDFRVVVEMNGATTELSEYTEDGTYLSFRFKNIAPQKIGDSVTATLYAKENGEEVKTNPYVFGVKAYCEKALGIYSDDAYAALRTLIVDLLRYGAKAQVYTGYKADTLSDADLTETQLAWGTRGDPVLANHFVKDLTVIENPAANWMGAGLVLDSAVTLKLKFAAESVEGLKVRIAIEDGDTIDIDSAYFRYDPTEGVYVLHVNGLNADQMSQKLELTVLDADGNAVSNTAQYSIESYAFEKQNSTIPGLADLVKAMMHYGNAAKAYGAR